MTTMVSLFIDPRFACLRRLQNYARALFSFSSTYARECTRICEMKKLRAGENLSPRLLKIDELQLTERWRGWIQNPLPGNPFVWVRPSVDSFVLFVTREVKLFFSLLQFLGTHFFPARWHFYTNYRDSRSLFASLFFKPFTLWSPFPDKSLNFLRDVSAR